MSQRPNADGPTPAPASRRAACAALVAALAAAPCLAAGAEGATRPLPRPAASAVDWSGPYGGLSLGVARSDGEAERAGIAGDLIALDVSNGLFPDAIDDAETGAIGGLTFGVSRQRGALVGGVEIDASLLDQDVALDFARIDPNPNPLFFGIQTITRYRTETRSLATLRLRAGYARGSSLLYATAGLAGGEVLNAFSLELPELGYTSPDDWREDGFRYGYALGLGVEHRVSARVSLKAEAMYYDLEDVTVEATDPATFPGQRLDYEFANDGAIARVGLNVAF